jgi:hypothetical protein
VLSSSRLLDCASVFCTSRMHTASVPRLSTHVSTNNLPKTWLLPDPRPPYAPLYLAGKTSGAYALEPGNLRVDNLTRSVWEAQSQQPGGRSRSRISGSPTSAPSLSGRSRLTSWTPSASGRLGSTMAYSIRSIGSTSGPSASPAVAATFPSRRSAIFSMACRSPLLLELRAPSQSL